MQAVSPTADRASYSGHDTTWMQRIPVSGRMGKGYPWRLLCLSLPASIIIHCLSKQLVKAVFGACFFFPGPGESASSLPNPNTLQSSISKYGSAVELLGKKKKKRMKLFSPWKIAFCSTEISRLWWMSHLESFSGPECYWRVGNQKAL